MNRQWPRPPVCTKTASTKTENGGSWTTARCAPARTALLSVNSRSALAWPAKEIRSTLKGSAVLSAHVSRYKFRLQKFITVHIYFHAVKRHSIKPGSYFCECERHKFATNNSQQFNSTQLTYEYLCERRVVTSHSRQIRFAFAWSMNWVLQNTM